MQAITLAEDHTIRVWDLRNHSCVQTINPSGDWLPTGCFCSVHEAVKKFLHSWYALQLWLIRVYMLQIGSVGRTPGLRPSFMTFITAAW